MLSIVMCARSITQKNAYRVTADGGDQMEVKIASASLGQYLQGILTNADVQGVTVELINKETFILHEEVAVGTDFIMGRRSEDHKKRIIPFMPSGLFV